MVQGPGIGRDCAIFHVGEKKPAASSMETAVTDTAERLRYLICHAANNVLCAGAKPQTLSISLMLPPETGEETLRQMMDTANVCCKELHMGLAGGHTEVSDAVCRIVATVSVFGVCEAAVLPVSGLCPGMELVMTGFAGMEGTAILAQSHAASLLEKFPLHLVEEAKRFGSRLFVGEEVQEALAHGAQSMHDVSQGGVFGALWEMGESAGIGMEIEWRKIPIRQETVEICEFFGLNPYCLLTGGALLAAVRDGQSLVMELERRGIPAALIGRTTEKKGKVLLNGEERRFLEKPAQDEIFKISQKRELWQN